MRKLAWWLPLVILLHSIEVSAANMTDIQKAICARDVKAVETALAVGFDPNIEFSEGFAKGFTPLTLALESIDCERSPNFDLILLLVEHGADINKRASIYGGVTPLREGVSSLDVQSVEYLLNRGADPNIGDVNGRTPLMSFSNDKTDRPLRIVEALLRAGADPSAQSKDGLTPEKWAIELRRLDIAELIRRAKK